MHTEVLDTKSEPQLKKRTVYPRRNHMLNGFASWRETDREAKT